MDLFKKKKMDITLFQENHLDLTSHLLAKIKSLKRDYFLDSLKGNLTAETEPCFIVRKNEKQLGILFFQENDDFFSEYVCNISFLHEMEEPQNYAELLKFIENQLLRFSVQDQDFYVNANNPDLIHFLKSEGFKEWEREHEMVLEKSQMTPFVSPTNLRCTGYEEVCLAQYLELWAYAFAELRRKANFQPILWALENPKLARKELVEANERGEFFAFWKEETLVGISFLEGNFLDTIAVKTEYQRQGMGSMILSVCLDYVFHQRQFDYITLELMDANASARDFYLKQGFQKMATGVMLSRE